jgi:hypothetical protein
VILHVGNASTFIGPFRKLINSEFLLQAHRFWLTASENRHGIEKASDVYIVDKGFLGESKAYLKLIYQMHSAKKIMLHGLMNDRVVVLLALMPWLMSKCYWMIWGADLYQYKTPRNSWKSRLKEQLRRLVIRRVGHLVTYIEGDVELARQWYGAKGTYHECIMYLSNVVDPRITVEKTQIFAKNGLNILLGNSADPGNNHIEALERLLPYKDQDIKIYAPLSYGGQKHALKVMAYGREWFGDKFVPMTDFMPFERYLEFLNSLDIAIFNHRRQQAMGNTITLLGMGKTIYLKSNASHWRALSSLGIKLNDLARLELKTLEAEEAQKNKRIVHLYFSKAMLINQLSEIFEG